MSSLSSQDHEDEQTQFDPAVCAGLYNRIIHISFEGSQSTQQGHLAKDWFHVFRDDPHIHECREMFPDPLISFLEQIEVFVDHNGHPQEQALIHHLQAISSPTLIQGQKIESSWMGNDEFIFPFRNNLYGIQDCPGVIMDLFDQTVCYLSFLYDFKAGVPEASPWYPLETLLARLNAIIEVGKYRPVPHGKGKGHDGCYPLSPSIATWEVVPWTDFILKQSLDAYNALIEAITARLPSLSDNQHRVIPLATESSLFTDVKGFPRAFLLGAAKPPFKFIAPGLTIYDVQNPPPLPTISPETSRYETPSMQYEVAFHDPLILFPAVSSSASPLTEAMAGLWIAPDEGWADTVRLVLPYCLTSYPDHKGKQFTKPSAIGLWQQGECPFYVEHGTRLATMLDIWRGLIEAGIWTIGEDGVEGGVDFYRQAEEVDKAKWFYLGDDCFDLSGVEW